MASHQLEWRVPERGRAGAVHKGDLPICVGPIEALRRGFEQQSHVIGEREPLFLRAFSVCHIEHRPKERGSPAIVDRRAMNLDVNRNAVLPHRLEHVGCAPASAGPTLFRLLLHHTP